MKLIGKHAHVPTFLKYVSVIKQHKMSRWFPKTIQSSISTYSTISDIMSLFYFLYNRYVNMIHKASHSVFILHSIPLSFGKQDCIIGNKQNVNIWSMDICNPFLQDCRYNVSLPLKNVFIWHFHRFNLAWIIRVFQRKHFLQLYKTFGLQFILLNIIQQHTLDIRVRSDYYNRVNEWFGLLLF